MSATTQQKIDYLEKLVNKFDQEDMDSGKFSDAESRVDRVLGAFDPNYLQVTRLTNDGTGDIKLTKVFVLA
jgi:hypothetical protein